MACCGEACSPSLHPKPRTRTRSRARAHARATTLAWRPLQAIRGRERTASRLAEAVQDPPAAAMPRTPAAGTPGGLQPEEPPRRRHAAAAAELPRSGSPEATVPAFGRAPPAGELRADHENDDEGRAEEGVEVQGCRFM